VDSFSRCGIVVYSSFSSSVDFVTSKDYGNISIMLWFMVASISKVKIDIFDIRNLQ
jgi:hypothetical protein